MTDSTMPKTPEPDIVFSSIENTPPVDAKAHRIREAYRHKHQGYPYPSSRDARYGAHGSSLQVADDDIRDRHELFLLGDNEKKVEVEAVTQIANAAIFKFNKEDHTLANMLRDKLFRMEHVTFAAYKVPHPLFATFELRVHTDGEISPKEAVVLACKALVQELQVLDQEFTKEFELRKITGQGPSAGLDI